MGMDKIVALSVKKAFLIGLGVAFLFFLTFYDDGSIWQKRVDNGNRDLTALNKKLEDLRRDEKKILEFQRLSKEKADRLERILRTLPEELSTADLIQKLSSEANASGVGILSIKPIEKVRDHGFFEELAVEISLEGEFSQLVAFLSYLTNVSQILTVSKLNLVARTYAADNKSVDLALSGVFSGYRYKKPKDKDGNI